MSGPSGAGGALRPEDLPPLRAAADGDGGEPFSTARVGIDDGGYQDHVKRREAWEAAHRGKVRLAASGEWSAYLPGEVPFPLDGAAPWGLRELMDRLDRAERNGLCPVHGPAS